MSIIQTVEEIKKYISVDGSFDFNTLMPHLTLSIDRVKQALGEDLYKLLDEHYNAPEEIVPVDPEEEPPVVLVEPTDLDNLLPFAQRPIVFFAFLKGLDVFNVSIGNNGIGVVSTNHIAPASKERVENLRLSLENSALDAIEEMFEFLEINLDKYSPWSNSEDFYKQEKHLISTAKQFNSALIIPRKGVTYLEIRPDMDDVEIIQMNPVVSLAFMDELRLQAKTDVLTTANKIVYPILIKALAYLTMATRNENKTLEAGLVFLKMAKDIMDISPDSYPTYRDSSVYIGFGTADFYENDPESGVVIFGW